MSTVTVLSVPGHRRSVENATRWLEQTRHDALLLGLPQDLERFVQAYAQREVSENELWNSYCLMTGMSRPLVNSLRAKLKPVLRYLSSVALKRRVKVYCYDELATHVESGKFAEESLLLSYRERVCHELSLEKWRRTLLEELHMARSTWKRSIENLVEKATQNVENAVFYEGLVGPLVKYLRECGVSVRVAPMPPFWRPPLEALRTAMRLEGESCLSDDSIRKAVELHMKYLDIVLTSESLDESERRWAEVVSFRKNLVADQTFPSRPPE